MRINVTNLITEISGITVLKANNPDSCNINQLKHFGALVAYLNIVIVKFKDLKGKPDNIIMVGSAEFMKLLIERFRNKKGSYPVSRGWLLEIQIFPPSCLKIINLSIRKLFAMNFAVINNAISIKTSK